ncbi:MAG: DUF3379 family protein [Proteobacteria bacterium]|nr:DUF3379 family protein [Pseudomonadota bacterium]
MNTSGKIMNCENYREAIAADPSESFEGGAGHAAVCESCSAYRAEIQALDLTIARALAIDVPELKIPDLPPIGEEDGNVVNLPFRRVSKITTPAWIGIAASFALAAVIGMQFVGNGPSHDQLLAAQVLAHLDHEPWALKVTNVAVSEERLAQVVNPGVGTMDRDIGLVTFAQTCIINGRTIPHLVIQGEKGPITLLLMPDEMVSSAVILSGESVNGVILPVGDGSIAIIGARGERIEDLKQRVVDSVEWSI